MKSWCKLKNMYCSMATINGYCQVTVCMHMAEPMPICNDVNAIMPYETPKVNWKVDGMIPIEWINKYIDSTLDEGNSQMLGFKAAIIKEMIEEWEKENDKMSEM